MLQSLLPVTLFSLGCPQAPQGFFTVIQVKTQKQKIFVCFSSIFFHKSNKSGDAQVPLPNNVLNIKSKLPNQGSTNPFYKRPENKYFLLL